MASSRNEPIKLKAGDNGEVSLFVGKQVQVADIDVVKDSLVIINRGVQNASLLVPHAEEIF